MNRGWGWFLYPGFTVLVVFFFSMFLWNVGLSFLKWPGFGPPEFAGVDNYRRMIENQDFWESWIHVAYYVIPFSLLPTGLALLLAAASYETFIGKWLSKLVPVARSGFFLPQIVPISISALIWMWILDQPTSFLVSFSEAVGWETAPDSWLREPIPALLVLSVFMLWLQMGFAYIVFIAGLSRLNPTLLEAAHLDGAGRWARLRWIIAPSLKPEIFVILVFLTVGAIKVFAPVYYLTGGDPYGSTSSPATFAISNFYGGRSVGYGSAITTTLAVVIAVGLGVTFWIVNRIRARGEQQ